ncbi:Methyltransferase type 11 [Candidatus Sulfopaludibacter sp. SbA6]|nr:Methyltransferase type 11 [Candidatus Sulfopaludibacter sp. SbA6]
MEWFEDEEFWRELYPYMFPAERMAAAAVQVGQLLALTGFNGRAVLDLCCGPGRHAVELARRGFAVTGVDRSPFLLERARERASEAGVAIEWVMEDMRRFRRPQAFDLACNIFTSFGYFEAEDDDLRVLRNVHESLTDDGVFVMEIIGKERLARTWKDSLCTDYSDGAMVVARPRLRDDWTRVANEWILLKDGRTRTFHFEHTLYSGRELKDRLLSAGFAEAQLYGDFEGSEYGLDALRLVAVARKAPTSRTSE